MERGFEASSYGKKRLEMLSTCRALPCHILIKILNFIFMKIFKNIPADKIGNFILTVITAFVSTFLMQSCGLPNVL